MMAGATSARLMRRITAQRLGTCVDSSSEASQRRVATRKAKTWTPMMKITPPILKMRIATIADSKDVGGVDLCRRVSPVMAASVQVPHREACCSLRLRRGNRQRDRPIVKFCAEGEFAA